MFWIWELGTVSRLTAIAPLVLGPLMPKSLVGIVVVEILSVNWVRVPTQFGKTAGPGGVWLDVSAVDSSIEGR